MTYIPGWRSAFLFIYIMGMRIHIAMWDMLVQAKQKAESLLLPLPLSSFKRSAEEERPSIC